MGCFMGSKDKVVIHLNRAHGLPKGQKTYVKTKHYPDPANSSKKSTVAYDYKETVVYDDFVTVRYMLSAKL